MPDSDTLDLRPGHVEPEEALDLQAGHVGEAPAPVSGLEAFKRGALGPLIGHRYTSFDVSPEGPSLKERSETVQPFSQYSSFNPPPGLMSMQEVNRPGDPYSREAYDVHPMLYQLGQVASLGIPWAIDALNKLAGPKAGQYLQQRGIERAKRVLTGGAEPLAVKKPISNAEAARALESSAVEVGGTTQSAAEKLKTLRADAGTHLGEIIDEAATKGVKGDALEIAVKLEQRGKDVAKETMNAEVPGLYQKMADRLLEVAGPDGSLPLDQLEALKRSLQGKANYQTLNVGEMENARREIASTLRGSSEAAVAAQADPETAAAFLRAKQKAAELIGASRVADKGAAQAARRSESGLTAKLSGLTGAGATATAALMSGNPMGVLAAPAVKKGIEQAVSSAQKYLPSAMASTQYRLGKFLSAPDKMLANPAVQQSRFGAILLNAKQRGPLAQAVAHQALYDIGGSEYQELARQAGGEGGQ